MNNKQTRTIKENILKSLTEDPKNGFGIFNKKDGSACYEDIDLEMIMDAIDKGLQLAKEEINA